MFTETPKLGTRTFANHTIRDTSAYMGCYAHIYLIAGKEMSIGQIYKALMHSSLQVHTENRTSDAYGNVGFT